MIQPIHEEAVKTLRELLELHSGVRIGQLFAWLGVLAEDQFGRSLADVDDDQMLAVMRRHREELANSVCASQQLVKDDPLTPQQQAEYERLLAILKAESRRGVA